MKIQPVAKNAPSPIPTAAEAAANPALIEPARAGRTRRGLGALAGAGLFGAVLGPLTACVAREASDTPAVTPTPFSAAVPASAPLPAGVLAVAYDEATCEAPAPAPSYVPLVGPILEKALAEDGRGAFGCVAIDPPMMLSEADALDLIRQEFAKAGVRLLPAHELGERVLLPAERGRLTSRDRREIATEPKAHTCEWGTYWKDPPAMTKDEHKWIFDLATKDGSLLVEYLSSTDSEALADENTFQENPDGSFFIRMEWSSVTEYDFPRLADDLRVRFESRPSSTPVLVALFFDPLARTTGFDYSNIYYSKDPAQYQAAMEQLAHAREPLPQLSREKLREQIRFFLDWARKEGKIPLNGDPT